VAGAISVPGNRTTIPAYQARPKDAPGGTPLVLICHENRGLTEHIRDVARRYAKAGYVACAVDLLSQEGGTDAIKDPAQVPALLSGADASRHVGNFQAAVDYYKTQTSVAADRIGMTGFCFGGGITWRAVTAIPDIKAAAPYYGPPPPLDQVPNIKAAVLGVYSDDPGDFANTDRDKLVAALEAAKVTHEIKVYPGTHHAFHNDTGQRYNQEQALAAWKDTQDWFSRYLRA
jgi:carboxymethylenebutenolidase